MDEFANIPPGWELSSSGGTRYVLYRPDRNRGVELDFADMTDDERERALAVAVRLLEAVPNRHQRRSQRYVI